MSVRPAELARDTVIKIHRDEASDWEDDRGHGDEDMITPQFCYRKTCNGVVLRLRINPGDNSWLVIERKGNEREYIDIKESEVEDVMNHFNAIDRDPQRFAEFVDSVSAGS